MRLLLNATPEELERLGGDFTLYGDWLRLTRPEMSFQLVPSSRVRNGLAFVRKCFEKLRRASEDVKPSG